MLRIADKLSTKTWSDFDNDIRALVKAAVEAEGSMSTERFRAGFFRTRTGDARVLHPLHPLCLPCAQKWAAMLIKTPAPEGWEATHAEIAKARAGSREGHVVKRDPAMMGFGYVELHFFNLPLDFFALSSRHMYDIIDVI